MSVIFIFLSSRLNHGLGRKAEFTDMAAFCCHRGVPFDDPSRLARLEFTPTHSCPTAPQDLTWDPSAHSMLACGTTKVLSAYYWEDSFPPFHLLYTQIQKIWKSATRSKNPLSRVQRNIGISTSAWAKPALTFSIREDMQQDLRMIPGGWFKPISASHPPLKSGWKRRKQRSCRTTSFSSPA